jgi:hypothetical protein
VVQVLIGAPAILRSGLQQRGYDASRSCEIDAVARPEKQVAASPVQVGAQSVHHCKFFFRGFSARKSLARNNKTVVQVLRSRISTALAAKPASTRACIYDDPRRRTDLAFVPLVCRPLRLGDLAATSAVTMIEDISQDHPDRMRIVNSVNIEQCPDCYAYGCDYKPRRRRAVRREREEEWR